VGEKGFVPLPEAWPLIRAGSMAREGSVSLLDPISGRTEREIEICLRGVRSTDKRLSDSGGWSSDGIALRRADGRRGREERMVTSLVRKRCTSLIRSSPEPGEVAEGWAALRLQGWSTGWRGGGVGNVRGEAGAGTGSWETLVGGAGDWDGEGIGRVGRPGGVFRGRGKGAVLRTGADLPLEG
jgi:hypothetical protein